MSLSRFVTYSQRLTSQRGNDLKELVSLSREGTTLILDEVSKFIQMPCIALKSGSKFYSWYIYPDNDHDFGKSISSSKYIDDVNNVRDIDKPDGGNQLI